MSLVDMPDGQGFHRTLVITGLNLQLVSGDDDSYSPLQTANLIVGYAVAPTGSHNILHGEGSTIDRSSGCMVSGRGSSAYQSQNCVVIANQGYVSNGLNDVIVGGSDNSIHHEAPFSARASVVVGGVSNIICSGEYAFIGGGYTNSLMAHGLANTIVGGADNLIGPEPAICFSTSPTYTACAITGGSYNWIHGAEPVTFGATISGGQFGVVTGSNDWLAGDLFQDE